MKPFVRYNIKIKNPFSNFFPWTSGPMSRYVHRYINDPVSNITLWWNISTRKIISHTNFTRSNVMQSLLFMYSMKHFIMFASTIRAWHTLSRYLKIKYDNNINKCQHCHARPSENRYFRPNKNDIFIRIFLHLSHFPCTYYLPIHLIILFSAITSIYCFKKFEGLMK